MTTEEATAIRRDCEAAWTGWTTAFHAAAAAARAQVYREPEHDPGFAPLAEEATRHRGEYEALERQLEAMAVPETTSLPLPWLEEWEKAS